MKCRICDEYFELIEYSFEINKSKENTIICNNVLDFISFICEQRNYDLNEIYLKIGLDGGGGFFRICLTFNKASYLHTNEKRRKFCYDENQPQSKLKDSGVKKLFILCIVPDMQENYFNVLQLWNLLKLNEFIQKFKKKFQLQQI